VLIFLFNLVLQKRANAVKLILFETDDLLEHFKRGLLNLVLVSPVFNLDFLIKSNRTVTVLINQTELLTPTHDARKLARVVLVVCSSAF